MNIENLSMKLILHAGNAKGYLHGALRDARNAEFDQIDLKVKQAANELLEAHNIQTKLIQEDAKNDLTSLPVILVHAQDHLMTVMSEKDLIEEMIEMYRKQHKMNVKLDELIDKAKLK
ncbi:PTS cellobiose transporter subunit IIA [Virgibacillus phasianinus]|uniref:PTS cellobiose transporter subunit IIA n=1 Tax=Virgibacillus phasianinus TaxID=2017483 RepID=A0A220U702_9BACI|nr:PTS lactose/cellobiose transporter subunit IIA [Virgibacillus phasianinus]ASK63870.1 PTS cellobiose transporter subunit IIA [Virgibacillus phasianinus]